MNFSQSKTDRIEQLFDLLDHWRHLPAYQLERRADILFALYLPEFFSERLGIPIRGEMIPEFPVRLGTVYPESSDNNNSCKIDYLAISVDRSQMWFVELKTDGLSRRQRQDDYLLRAQAVGMPQLLDGLLRIFAKTQAKAKYLHLLKLAESIGLLELPPRFHNRTESGWAGVAKDLAAIRISQIPRKISVIYLQPRATEPGEIGFDALADWLERCDDPLSRRFRDSLRRWAKSPAGEVSYNSVG
jgi:hypothetical protein